LTIDAAIFKAYDVRGIYPDQMDEAVAYRIGRGFAQVLADLEGRRAGGLRIGLGRDMRLSAPATSDRSRPSSSTSWSATASWTAA